MTRKEAGMSGNPLETLGKLDPGIIEHLRAGDQFVFADGVAALAQRAMKAGATVAEITEAVRVAGHLAGVGSLHTASRGLKDIAG